MRLGLMVGYSGARIDLPMDLVLEADQAGIPFGLDIGSVRLRLHHAAGLDRRAN